MSTSQSQTTPTTIDTDIVMSHSTTGTPLLSQLVDGLYYTPRERAGVTNDDVRSPSNDMQVDAADGDACQSEASPKHTRDNKKTDELNESEDNSYGDNTNKWFQQK